MDICYVKCGRGKRTCCHGCQDKNHCIYACTVSMVSLGYRPGYLMPAGLTGNRNSQENSKKKKKRRNA